MDFSLLLPIKFSNLLCFIYSIIYLLLFLSSLSKVITLLTIAIYSDSCRSFSILGKVTDNFSLARENNNYMESNTEKKPFLFRDILGIILPLVRFQYNFFASLFFLNFSI